jgi:hypothetical protein
MPGIASVSFQVLFITALLQGCGFYTAARVTVNDQITHEDVSFIEPGKTTFIEVVSRLGAPDELTGEDHGAVITYHFRDAKYSRVNLGWPLRFWVSVQPDVIFAGGAFGTDMFQVGFDQRWVAQHHAFAKHAQAVHHRLWPF